MRRVGAASGTGTRNNVYCRHPLAPRRDFARAQSDDRRLQKDIDRTLLRENLKLTPEQRILKLQDFVRFLMIMQEAGRKAAR